MQARGEQRERLGAHGPVEGVVRPAVPVHRRHALDGRRQQPDDRAQLAAGVAVRVVAERTDERVRRGLVDAGDRRADVGVGAAERPQLGEDLDGGRRDRVVEDAAASLGVGTARDTYLDEATGAPYGGMARMRTLVERVVAGLLAGRARDGGERRPSVGRGKP